MQEKAGGYGSSTGPQKRPDDLERLDAALEQSSSSRRLFQQILALRLSARRYGQKLVTLDQAAA